MLKEKEIKQFTACLVSNFTAYMRSQAEIPIFSQVIFRHSVGALCAGGESLELWILFKELIDRYDLNPLIFFQVEQVTVP